MRRQNNFGIGVCIFFGPDRTNGPGYTDHVHPQYFAHWNKSRRTDLEERIAMLVRIASKDSNAVM